MGHYTQMVWHETRFLGCGVSQCRVSDTAMRQVWVCLYYPPGNHLAHLPFCPLDKPAAMGQCDAPALDAAALRSGCGPTARPKAGSCGSAGAICSGPGTSGARTCGNGSGALIHGCQCKDGMRTSDGTECVAGEASAARAWLSALVLWAVVVSSVAT